MTHSLKKGIDSPITKASSQPTVTIVIHTDQPLTVCVRRWIEFSGKIWKKTARDVTSE